MTTSGLVKAVINRVRNEYWKSVSFKILKHTWKYCLLLLLALPLVNHTVVNTWPLTYLKLIFDACILRARTICNFQPILRQLSEMCIYSCLAGERWWSNSIKVQCYLWLLLIFSLPSLLDCVFLKGRMSYSICWNKKKNHCTPYDLKILSPFSFVYIPFFIETNKRL